MADSLWADSTMNRIVGKVINSEDEPADLESFAQKYEDKFGQEFGDMFRATRGKWGFNPALRQVMKIAANCGWGKHAQKIIQPSAEIIHETHDAMREEEIIRNCEEGNYKISKIESVGPSKRLIEYTKKESSIKPDLHKVALDAAAFVPAYGRLQLWQQLDRLEKSNPSTFPRVVNMDTDSIYYKHYPQPGIYNIPEGDLLGDWTRDDSPTDGGIVEFVGLGPKTYSYKSMNGKVRSNPNPRKVPPKPKVYVLDFPRKTLLIFPHSNRWPYHKWISPWKILLKAERETLKVSWSHRQDSSALVGDY